MKKTIYVAWFIAIPFLCLSQQKVKKTKVTKNKAGIIQSVEFPDSLEPSKIPPSAGVFLKDSLKTTGNSHSRKQTSMKNSYCA